MRDSEQLRSKKHAHCCELLLQTDLRALQQALASSQDARATVIWFVRLEVCGVRVWGLLQKCTAFAFTKCRERGEKRRNKTQKQELQCAANAARGGQVFCFTQKNGADRVPNFTQKHPNVSSQQISSALWRTHLLQQPPARPGQNSHRSSVKLCSIRSGSTARRARSSSVHPAAPRRSALQIQRNKLQSIPPFCNRERASIKHGPRAQIHPQCTGTFPALLPKKTKQHPPERQQRRFGLF